LAGTPVVYKYRWLKEDGFWSDEISLCFACAVSRTMQNVPSKHKVFLGATDNEFESCFDCGLSIDDRIDI